MVCFKLAILALFTASAVALRGEPQGQQERQLKKKKDKSMDTDKGKKMKGDREENGGGDSPEAPPVSMANEDYQKHYLVRGSCTIVSCSSLTLSSNI